MSTSEYGLFSEVWERLGWLSCWGVNGGASAVIGAIGSGVGSEECVVGGDERPGYISDQLRFFVPLGTKTAALAVCERFLVGDGARG